VEAIKLTSKRGIHTGAHFIFGLPGETPTEWFDQVKIINSLPINGIKFHQLQIIKNTQMEKEYHENPNDFHHFSLDSYIQFIITYLELLNPDFVVERFAERFLPAIYLLIIGEQFGMMLFYKKSKKHSKKKTVIKELNTHHHISFSFLTFFWIFAKKSYFCMTFIE
jgi:histone acetyltransferase (RNA polymerase elongator complex component)